MQQNALFAMQNILDKPKPNSQPGGGLTEQIETNKTRNLTMIIAHFELSFTSDLNRKNMFSFRYRVIFLQQPEAAFQDFYENFRWPRTKLSFNIQPMITPKIR